jgi:HEXXH motif-containing protein
MSAPEDAAAVDRALASLRDPAPLVSALRRPHVGALLRTLRGTPAGQGGAVLVELLATLAGDLAHLGAIPPVSLRRAPARVVSPLTRAAAYRAVEDDILLALEDNNPLAMIEAHPDKDGNAVDLGGRSIDAWLAALRAALELVAAHLPDVRREMSLYLHQIVPVGWFPDKHLSASYREAIGTAYLSLHPSGMTMVEALVHEFQHNKLNALLELDEVLENAHEPLYRSPVRPDPRPLHGVLLAVHAFVPVARLYERLIAGGATALEPRFRDVVRINREGTEVLLASGRPTAMGQGLMQELARWDAYYRRLA